MNSPTRPIQPSTPCPTGAHLHLGLHERNLSILTCYLWLLGMLDAVLSWWRGTKIKGDLVIYNSARNIILNLIYSNFVERNNIARARRTRTVCLSNKRLARRDTSISSFFKWQRRLFNAGLRYTHTTTQSQNITRQLLTRQHTLRLCPPWSRWPESGLGRARRPPPSRAAAGCPPSQRRRG